MDTTESLPIIAISIGLYQMFYRFNKVRKSDDDIEFDIVYILSGIIASLLKMLKSTPANKKEE